MPGFFDNFLSEQQRGFRKGYNTQHCVLNHLEKRKNSVDKSKSFGALLTGLSKALIVSTMNSSRQNPVHMNLIYLHYGKFQIAYQTENNKQKLMIIIAVGQKYYLAFHKGQF